MFSQDKNGTIDVPEPIDPVDFSEEFVQKEYEQHCIEHARNMIAHLQSPAREILLMKIDAGMKAIITQ